MKRYLKILPFFVPFIVGLIGFLCTGEEVLNAAFNSFLLYFLGYADPAANPAIEVARWIAPIATAGGAITVAVQFATSWKNAVRNGRRDSLAVYGDGPDAEFVKAQVGARLITPIGNGFVRARRYVLMMDEQENLEFYAANRERLKDCPVCLRCTSIASHELAGDRLKHFHVGENNRKLPGMNNTLDWARIGSTLREIGYDKGVVMEPFLIEGTYDVRVWRDLSGGKADDVVEWCDWKY